MITVFVVLLASCGNEPEEGEIVIRISDLSIEDAPDSSSLVEADTAATSAAVDTAAVAVADSAAAAMEPDSSAVADSSLRDSIAVPRCEWDRLAFEINGSIYSSLDGLVDNPDILGAHIVRCMWWNTNPWRGMNAGDSLYVLLGETGRENRVVALRYVPREGTVNDPFSVYSYRMTGDNFPSHYYADGTEAMKLLNYMPINTFEEMTGPYGEPRNDHLHSGVDYKAPRGTPVRTCRGGRVTRVNWNHDYNGNCVEIDIGGGYREIFLHLDSISQGIAPGTVLEKGDTVGCVGNTGRTSTAPHLHYQINDERGNSMDPYLFYSSHRRKLGEGEMDSFRSFRDSCEIWLHYCGEQIDTQ
ncbi:MAG: peptidoglycan DD-metalloendopeptidase family protein [Candidatus Aegiribacteria sp.]|nr:peptidoglycan DD-metalloendopeptidase family protein [Candidatus Aegiribacteria sp.]MBD3295375.1 peptidoglycan DD-metalloendopeptidase family protein [Candidatus Fermentibacteria bacterium]